MPELMTQADFAKRHSVGKPAVTRWKKLGLLVFVPDPERPGKELVNADLSDLLVRASVDPTRGRPRAADQAQADGDVQDGATAPAERQAPVARGGMSELETERLADMRERTRSRRIDNDVKLGALVPLAEYERRAGDLGRMAREGVHAVLRQHAERVAAETDPRSVMAVLGEAFDQLFDRLADEIEAEATKEREVDQALAAVIPDDGDEGEDEEPEA